MNVNSPYEELKVRRATITILLVMLFTAINWSCGSDEPDPGPVGGVTNGPVTATKKVVVFYLVVDQSYPTTSADHWIVISNSEGKMISYSSFESGDDIVLLADEDEVGDKISVTLLRHHPANNNGSGEQYYLTSYTDVGLMDKIELKSGQASGINNNNEEVTFNVSNLPASAGREISMSSVGSRIAGYSVIETADPATFTAQVALPLEDLFVAVTSFSTPKYIYLDLTQTHPESFDFISDFKIYDHVIALPTPTSRYDVAVFGYKNIIPGEPEPTYSRHVQASFHNESEGQLQVGFNDGYDKYHTTWKIKLEDGRSVSYSKTGAACLPGDFDVPALDFDVINTGINEFTYLSDDIFTYRTSVWSASGVGTEGEATLSWTVSSPADSRQPVITSFTDSLETVHPFLNTALQELTYGSTTFVKNVSNQSYTDKVSRAFRGFGLGLIESEYFTAEK